jgi:hypothetical protein
VFLCPYAFERVVDRAARAATANARAVTIFVAGLFLAPLLLMALS